MTATSTTTTAGAVGQPTRWAPALDRATAARLAATEYRRTLDQFRDLGPDDWGRATDCAAWDVRAMAGHVLGMAEMASSLPAAVRQNRAAAKAGGGVDSLTAVQVREAATLTPGQLVDRFAAVTPRAARGRRLVSRLLGRLPFPERQVINGRAEQWTFGYLVDVILTRDPWTHRMDVARATGRTPVLTADHDGVLIADAVAEWARRHGRPYRLHLTGPAGGTWTAGEGGPDLELDAVEFCRRLSGRGEGAQGLLATEVPF